MALQMADPESRKREDEIAKREAERFEPDAKMRQDWEAIRERNPDDVAMQLQNREMQGGQTPESSLTSSDDVQNKEAQGGQWNTNVDPKTPQAKQPLNFNSILKATRKKGPATTIILGLVIGLFLGGGFFGATLAPFMFVSNVTLDLNDPSSAIETRTVKQIGKTQFSTDSGSDKISAGCGLVGAKLSMKCKFKSISPWLEDKLKSVGIEVEGTKKIGGRVLPESYKYKGVTYTAEEFSVAIKGGNPELWSAYRKALNMNWLALKGKTFISKVLAKYGLTDTPEELSGNHDEDVKKVMNGESGGDNTGESTFTKKVDDAGEPVTDPNTNEEIWVEDATGKEYTTSGKDARITEVSKVATEIIGESSKPMSQMTVGALEKVTTGLNIIGWADAACTIRNIIGSGTIAAKISNAEQVATYAMKILPLVGKLQAGDATAEDARVIQEFFNDTDARKTITGLIEGKTEKDNPTPGEVTNPNYGKNAMDSELYKMSVGGGVAQTFASEANYSLGFGPKTIFKSVASKSLNVTNLVDDAAGISGCDIIQSGVVRAAGIGVGITAFVVSAFFGETGIGAVAFLGLAAKAVGTIVAVTTATIAITHMTNAALNGSLISNVMQYAPVDRGSATWTGLSVLLGTSSQMRGMMPASADEIVAYQKDQNEERQQVIAFERQQSNPLDITNQYSLTGSIVASMGTHFSSSLSSATMASLPTNLSSFVFGGLTSLFTPYSASAASMNSERFQQCDDTGYKGVGIDADVQCNVRYVMPEQSMTLDPLDTAQWMETNGYVEADTTTGYPDKYSPPAPEKIQGGAMNMVKGVAKSYAKGIINTVYNVENNYEDKYKSDKSPNGPEFAKFLDYCVYRAMPYGKTYEEDGPIFHRVGKDWIDGKNCRRTDDDAINRFRMYVFDMSVNDDLDGPVTADCPPGSTTTATTASSSANIPTAEAINTMIDKSAKANATASPLQGKGDKFIEFGKKYNVNPGVVTAILQRETQLASDGSSLYQAPFYNLGGNKASANDQGTCGAATWTDGNSYKKFCTIDDAIEGIFKNLDSDVYRKTDGTVAAVMEVYSPSNDGNDNGQAMYDIFGVVAKTLGITIDKSTQVYTNANTTTSTSSSTGNTVTGSKISESELKTLITSYGLPEPKADGEDGYTKLKSNLTSNPDAGWAAQQMLNGEKAWSAAGGTVKLYLNTAWVWFENGAGGWPDPYELNCKSNTEGSRTAEVCDVNPGSQDKMQVAGYQAWDVQDKFQDVFNKLYPGGDLSSILQRVVQDSSKAGKDVWKYNDPSNQITPFTDYLNSITTAKQSDIFANTISESNFENPKTQFISLILGKDPGMAAALNSFAVTDDDLIAVGFKGNGYGYIHDAEKQLVSNMIMALYQFDGAGPSSAVCKSSGSQPHGSGKGIAAIFNGTVPGITQEFGPTDFSAKNYEMYAYAAEYGMDPVGHTGIDYGVDLDTKLYSPVDGVVEIAGGTPYFTSTDRLNGGVSQPGTGELLIRMDNHNAVILGHMHQIDVKVGDKVTVGQYVGLSGTENGPHVHVEYRVPDPSTSSHERLRDPRDYL